MERPSIRMCILLRVTIGVCFSNLCWTLLFYTVEYGFNPCRPFYRRRRLSRCCCLSWSAKKIFLNAPLKLFRDNLFDVFHIDDNHFDEEITDKHGHIIFERGKKEIWWVLYCVHVRISPFPEIRLSLHHWLISHFSLDFRSTWLHDLFSKTCYYFCW